ncbi:hypothetical protein CAEBREN_07493 [Caenorhabditis brenneri]|uniref:Uncharacterized protein n=1 Tax=Caenorhabditis brenneri TaxID=135651 RepID=G0PHG8_CAEBE|nr:hypothetical protein CAEBREN_07493 [Caenorhabditis brenneri]
MDGNRNRMKPAIQKITKSIRVSELSIETVGMFANAKSSLPQGSGVQLEDSPIRHPGITNSYSTSPEKAAKVRITRREKLSKTWDFTDIVSNREQHTLPARQRFPPPLKKYDSEEDNDPYKEEAPTVSTKPELPWLKKWDSDDKATTKTPMKVDKLEIPRGFDETIARFSARLDRVGAIPSLSLQNHTKTTMGTVERALMGVAVTQSKSEGPQKVLPVFDLLVERSDWLMYREEFNDETDYPPKDPFYSHETVSSEFEEYEQDKEAASDSSYIKSRTDNKRSEDEPVKVLGFLEEQKDLDSQEDFFGKVIPTISEAHDSKQTPDNKLSLLDFSSSPPNRKSTKRAFPTNSFTPNMPSTSRKRSCPDDPLDNIPRIPTPSNFSPFNYSFLTDSPPGPSPKPSKYSFW